MPVLTVNECSPLSRTSRAVTAVASRSRDLGRAAGAVDVGADHDELVAAEPRDRVGRAHRVGQPGREREQHLVPGGVAGRVVDQLEAVEVEHEHRHVDALAVTARAPRGASRSSASVRFGRSVSGSCSAAWRVACSSR